MLSPAVSSPSADKRRGRGELRLAALGFPDPLARRVAAVEAAGLEQPVVEIGEFVGKGLGDQVADQVIIADPVVPFQLRVRRQGRLWRCAATMAVSDFTFGPGGEAVPIEP